MPLLTKSVADAYTTRKAASSSNSGGYLNTSAVREGDKVRITFLGEESATGFVCWVPSAADASKRVRLVFADAPTRSDLEERCQNEGAVLKDEKPRQFFSFFCWNYNEERVQVFEITQTGLITPIIEFLSDEEVSAEPHLYDVIVSATGSGLDKRYSILPMPGKRRVAATDKLIAAAFAEVVAAGGDISVVSSGGDPWKGTPF